jgi:hypothetical protein
LAWRHKHTCTHASHMHLGACIMVEDDAAHAELAELPICLHRREDLVAKEKKRIDLIERKRNLAKLATRSGAPDGDHGDQSRRGAARRKLWLNPRRSAPL